MWLYFSKVLHREAPLADVVLYLAASDVPSGVSSGDYPSQLPRFSANDVQFRRPSPRKIGRRVWLAVPGYSRDFLVFYITLQVVVTLTNACVRLASDMEDLVLEHAWRQLNGTRQEHQRLFDLGDSRDQMKSTTKDAGRAVFFAAPRITVWVCVGLDARRKQPLRNQLIRLFRYRRVEFLNHRICENSPRLVI